MRQYSSTNHNTDAEGQERTRKEKDSGRALTKTRRRKSKKKGGESKEKTQEENTTESGAAPKGPKKSRKRL